MTSSWIAAAWVARWRWPLSLAGVLVLGGILGWWLAAPPALPRVVLLLPVPATGDGLDSVLHTGLLDLLKVHLEAVSDAPVLLLPGELQPSQVAALEAQDRVLRCRFFRQGKDLGLSIEMARVEQLSRNPAPPWQRWEYGPGNPEMGLFNLVHQLAGGRNRTLHLEPVDPDQFWTLVRVAGLLAENAELQTPLRLAGELLQRAPDCPTVHMVWADASYRIHLREANNTPAMVAETEAHYRRGLALAPGHPELSLQLAQMKSDAGEHRGALEALAAGLREHPRSPSLLTGLAYAARTAGQLELARRACLLKLKLVPREIEPAMAENTFLYLGDFTAFRNTLQIRPGHRRSALVWFYRGYLDLAEGRPVEALQAFREAEVQTRDIGHFNRLGQVFRLHLMGQATEALALLQGLDHGRAGLRVPDGEFTFKIAEAYALLGHREEAVDLAQRAYAQGFLCARWYAESPFLRAVQPMPRYRALLHSVEERQALLASGFPPSRFF